MKVSLAFLIIGGLVAAATSSPRLVIPPKARALTLETSAFEGGAVVQAGDHVDVLSVLHDPETKWLAGVTLLQNVIVLNNSGEPRQLSLLLLPEEALMVALARGGGRLSLTLRNPADDDVIVAPRKK